MDAMPNEAVSQAVIVPTSSGVGTVRAAAVPASAPAPTPAPASGPELVLNIVHDQASGLFIYKFIDPTTGRVVEQLPTAGIAKLGDAAEYSAGKLISTKV